MTTIGKVCLWLTVIGLGVISVYLLPSVGKKHNEVAAQLRSSKKAVDDGVDAHWKKSQELAQRRFQLAREQIGWDKTWTIEQGANTRVEIQDGRLVVNGLGMDAGFVPVLDAAGQESAPAVHVFKTMPEAGMVYVGEFQAEQLEADFTVLVPIWQVTADEVESWVAHMELPWRFRTLVPAARRLHIDRLRAHLQRLAEDLDATDANVVQQEKLLEDAESQLLVRKQELMGNPQAQSIPGRPEFSDGLIRAIASEEERRNDLQVDIDQLRRLIQDASQERDQRVQKLKEQADQLKSGGGDSARRDGRSVELAVPADRR